MNIKEVFNSRAIASVVTEAGSNKVAYLGAGLFPAKKKMGLDLKWIKGHKGLAVSLAPSNFDAVSTIRSRQGMEISETQMAFFRESMLLKEADRQELLRVKEANDPYAQDVIGRIYDDAQTLVDGANVIPERMIMQLLTPANGHPSISIQANGVTYAYNYDPSGDFAKNNFDALSGTDVWSDTVNSDPLADVENAKAKVQAQTGVEPKYMIINSVTLGYLKKNQKIKDTIVNPTAGATYISAAKIKEVFSTELGITLLVYDKQYDNGAKFFADGFATLIPEGQLGNTWYGTTPEEADLMGNADVDVSIVNTGVAVATSVSNDPVQVKTTVSEIVLPSFENMDQVYVIKAF